LRDIACSFRKSKLLVFLLLISLSLAQCRAEDVWGIPKDQALARLARGDASFLQGVQAHELSQAFRLGPGSPYYLSFWAREAGDPAQARALLLLQWEKGRGRWREEAALALLADYAAQGEWAEAEAQARRFLPSLRSPELRRAGERALAEALYWQRKDAELLPWLDRLAEPPQRAGGQERAAAREHAAAQAQYGADEELLLFRAAAFCRLEAPGWPDLFRELFFQRKASGLHPRAWSFLQLEERLRLGHFSPAEAAFFGAKAALASGRAAEALAAIESSFPALPPAVLAPLLPEAASAFLQAGEPARGARLLAPLVEDSDGAEWAGRLARRAGDLAAAEAAFRRVVRESAVPAQRDRASWLLLDLARDRSTADFLTELEGQRWEDPSYFADILEQEISAMVAGRRWGELARLRSALQRAQAPGTPLAEQHALAPQRAQGPRARLAWLEGRLRQLGLLEGDPQEGFREAARLDPGGYHGLLASASLPEGGRPDPAASAEAGGLSAAEEEPETPEPEPEAENPGAWAGPAGKAADRAAVPEAFLMGFIEHGLYQAAYRRLLSPRAAPEVLLRAARALAGRGQYLLCLRLLARYLEDGPASEEVLRLYYPRGFAEPVEEACRAEGLSPAIFFALVREESHFDPGIVSSAGAVGLTQLLPDTAQEVGRLMRIAEPDLRDPATNLRIGARHLARLAARSRDLARALLAYNAGAGRLRSWERGAAGLPSDLLVEAVPFAESRRYVRKVLVSAVRYGELYYGLSVRDTVRLLYP
jgi:soluble lytic murein transglycosylase